MKTRSKRILTHLIVFAIGIGIGIPGGFFINDYVEREHPDLVEQIREDFRTQQELDDIFAQQREARATSEGGSGEGPSPAEEAGP